MTAKHQLYIDGVWRHGSGRDEIAVINPANEEEVARVCLADTKDMDDALDAAARGFRLWRGLPAVTRAGYLQAVARLLRERASDIADGLTAEQGKPLAQSKAEIFGTAAYFDDLGTRALDAFNRDIPTDAAGVSRTVVHEPVGPVFAVSPWNLPAMMPGRKIANSLAAGCSIIVKPAKETPGTACQLARCCADAGIPAGVVNVLCGHAQSMSRHMIASGVIRKVSFTGSTEVGKEIAALAGAYLKKATLELGGHAPVIICADADIETVAALMVTARHSNAGQSCMAPTRFFVADQVYARFVERFTAGARALRLGAGIEPDVDMGPLASHRRLAVMNRLVDDATTKGATLRTGGLRVGDRGHFFAPTVLADVPQDALIMCEEPFGPVSALVPYTDIARAIERANETPYGLASYVFTRDTDLARTIADGLEAGLVGINSTSVAAPSVPFGGVKDSGVGREGSLEGLLDSMVTKTISAGRM
jgi:succinate-semialdehyde dehydrogenase/glutarate-semialdehyde dehydrogenase